MEYEIFLLSFGFSIFCYLVFIPIFRKKKLNQTVRTEGPKSHYFKNGTPTFGGIVFVFVVTLVFLFYFSLDYFYNNVNKIQKIYDLVIILFPMIFYSLIGFLDDGLIIRQGKNNGLNPKIKLIFQIFGGLIYSIMLYLFKNNPSTINIFGKIFDLGLWYYLFVIFILTASSNAVNLTDGIDGLSGGSFLISIFSIILFTVFKKENQYLIYSLTLFGAVLGYLVFNAHKAKVFMGDSGSLALGAVLGSLTILLKIEILLIPIGIVYVLETLSVIIQVLYFKLTKGKRVFKMAPIHHHLELTGLTELKIDYLLWLIGLFGSLYALYLGLKFY